MKEAILEITCPAQHELSEAPTLLNLILDKKIPISHSCGGNGTCGTCRVLVLFGEANLTKPSEIESEFKAQRSFKPQERLSCQAFVTGTVKIQICQLDE